MGLRGPTPKPTAIRILEGNPSRRPIRNNEPKPEQVTPICPSWLDKDGRAEWHRVVPQLEKMGVLAKIDRGALALYCDAWSQFLAVRVMLQSEGMTYSLANGYVQQRPEVSVYHKLQAILKSWTHEFGLTPSARGRMTVGDKAEDADPFEAFLNKG